MNMVNKVFKLEDHQAVLVLIYLICSEERNHRVLERENQDLFLWRSLLNKFITAVWKKSRFKELETVRLAKERVVKMYKNAQNAKEEELYRN